jgi:HSP20 family protein
MSNIVKTNGGQLAPEIDPFRVMRELLRWDPFRAMTPAFSPLETVWTPSFEVRENGDSFRFEADLPGMKPENVEVSLTDNRLQISGKREEEKETKEDTYYVRERSYGEFSRTFTLPDGADAEHIRSAMKDGVLTVVVPKKATAKPKKIDIATEAKKS